MGGRGGGLYASQCSTLSTTLSTPPARRQYHGVLRPTPPYLKRNTIGSSIITSQVCRRKVCRNFTGMFQMAGSLLLGLWVVNGFVGGASWATHVAPCSMEYSSGIPSSAVAENLFCRYSIILCSLFSIILSAAIPSKIVLSCRPGRRNNWCSLKTNQAVYFSHFTPPTNLSCRLGQ